MPIINKGHELKIGDKLKRVGDTGYADFVKDKIYVIELIIKQTVYFLNEKFANGDDMYTTLANNTYYWEYVEESKKLDWTKPLRNKMYGAVIEVTKDNNFNPDCFCNPNVFYSPYTCIFSNGSICHFQENGQYSEHLNKEFDLENYEDDSIIVNAVYDDFKLVKVEFKQRTRVFTDEIDFQKLYPQVMLSSNFLFNKEYFAELIGDEKMELKDIKQESLEAGKELVEQQKLSEEIIFAKNEYKRLTDLKDRYEREIKAQKENLDKIFEELKVFGVKKTRKSRV